MSRHGDSKLTILVSGMIAGVPQQGGAAWAVLQYVLGFRRLGHEVVFVEQCDRASIRPAGAPLASSENARYMKDVMTELGLDRPLTLLVTGTQESFGAPYAGLRESARDSDLLINISGTLTDDALIGDIPVRAYLDLDPAFNQLWHVEGLETGFGGHTHFVTVGQGIGSPDSPVPTCGLSWIPTLPPVALEHWPRAGPITHDALTTVGHWRGYGSIEHSGVHYGQRAHSMRAFMSLPGLTEADFLLALAIHPDETKDVAALERNGWDLVDPVQVAATPAQYQAFIQGSMAEFGVAKSGYVASRCGWFSDRSACYLASGRPVVAQETGFSRFLPTGQGLFAFESMDDALGAIEELRQDYARHSSAARALAEEHLDSDKVLTRLLDELGAAAPTARRRSGRPEREQPA